MPCVYRRLYTENVSGLQERCFSSAYCQAFSGKRPEPVSGKRPEPGSGWKFRQECHIQDTSAYFMFIFSGMSAGSFLGVQSRNQMDREKDRIAQAEFGDVVQLTGQVMDVREKAKNWK